ncbi:MAG: glycosyltransferase [Patescibacteria group bacterium]
MKVAIVCDWLTGKGGAERVVKELSNLYPDAPIYTSQYDPKKIDWFDGSDVRTGWLQKISPKLKKFLPVLRAIYFSKLDLSDYDLVISSSGAEAKYIKAKKHICYMHAPSHYYWARYDQYLEYPGFPKGTNWLARLGLRILVGPLRKLDYKKVQAIDHIITNSNYTKAQIKKYYDRDSTVVHPPVDMGRFTKTFGQTKRSGFVVIGRQTPYKKIDLAVSACTNLNLGLKVMGGGPDNTMLRSIAGPTIEFFENPTDVEIVTALQSAEGFIFPGIDDFGIVSIEAMSAGTPVIAYKDGGALDYVIPGKTGEFFEEQSVQSLSKTLDKFVSKNYNPELIIKSAQQFSSIAFHDKMKELMKEIN